MKKLTKVQGGRVFTKSQIRGITVLIILLITIIGFRIYQNNHYNKISLRYQQQKATVKEEDVTPRDDVEKRREKKIYRKAGFKIKDQYFDPNTVSYDKLLEFTIPDKIAGRILKYRINGGRFSQPEDLYKIYGMDSTIMGNILPHIKIDNRKILPGDTIPAGAISINYADTSDFTRLRGIGKVLAGRIIKYRKALGGFYKTGQIKEVYGIEDKLFNNIAEKLKVDSTQLRYIDINSADYKKLISHPYLIRPEVRAILIYRKTMGKILDKTELLERHIISTQTYQKIHPYLKTD